MLISISMNDPLPIFFFPASSLQLCLSKPRLGEVLLRCRLLWRGFNAYSIVISVDCGLKIWNSSVQVSIFGVLPQCSGKTDQTEHKSSQRKPQNHVKYDIRHSALHYAFRQPHPERSQVNKPSNKSGLKDSSNFPKEGEGRWRRRTRQFRRQF